MSGVDTNLDFLGDIITLLAAAVFIVALFKKMKLSPVLGYFAAGILIGPQGLMLIEDSSSVSIFAEFGVVFLLFMIGLELDIDRMKSMRVDAFGFGTLQTLMSWTVIYLVCISFGLDLTSSLIISGGLAFSSTALVIQVLEDTGQQSTRVGKLALAVLIMQDFIVIPILVLLQLLHEGSSDGHLLEQLGRAVGKSSISFLVMLAVGRLLLRPALSYIASFRSNELFVAFALLVVLGASYCTHMINFSMASGAFIAGFMMSETEHRKEVEQAVLPFKGLLLGLFFMTVGMSINLSVLSKDYLLISSIVISLLTIKSVIIFLLCKAFRFHTGASVHASLLLSQGSEFAFILFGIANGHGIISSYIAQVLMASVTVSMALTPLLEACGRWVSRRMDGHTKTYAKEIEKSGKDIQNIDEHVIIAGFGRTGRVVAKMLNTELVSYIAIDNLPDIVRKANKDGYPIYKGDFTKVSTLKALRLDRAVCVVFAAKNNPSDVRKSIKMIKKLYHHIEIVIELDDYVNEEMYRKLGATQFVPLKYEAGLLMGSLALQCTVGISHKAIVDLRNAFRSNKYSGPVSTIENDSE